MTEAQRNAIPSPVPAGLVVWCIDCGNKGQMQVFNGAEWTDMTGGTAATFICGTTTITFIYNGSLVTYGTVLSAGQCWLDRNLGATLPPGANTLLQSQGDLFQWGRGHDGHQIRTSFTATAHSNTNSPGHSNFILAPNSPFDWRIPQNVFLWQGTTGTNNPCP